MRYSGHQQSQENVAWVFRLSLWIDPHSGHVRLVLRGSTATTWMPLSVALCVKNFTLAVVKQGASTLAANEPNLLAAGKRPDAHPVVGDEPEDAIVVRLRRVFAQFDDAFRVVGFLRCLGVGPPCRCNECRPGRSERSPSACRHTASFADRICGSAGLVAALRDHVTGALRSSVSRSNFDCSFAVGVSWRRATCFMLS
jgi:hypothetical protein